MGGSNLQIEVCFYQITQLFLEIPHKNEIIFAKRGVQANHPKPTLDPLLKMFLLMSSMNLVKLVHVQNT